MVWVTEPNWQLQRAVPDGLTTAALRMAPAACKLLRLKKGGGSLVQRYASIAERTEPRGGGAAVTPKVQGTRRRPYHFYRRYGSRTWNHTLPYTGIIYFD